MLQAADWDNVVKKIIQVRTTTHGVGTFIPWRHAYDHYDCNRFTDTKALGLIWQYIDLSSICAIVLFMQAVLKITACTPKSASRTLTRLSAWHNAMTSHTVLISHPRRRRMCDALSCLNLPSNVRTISISSRKNVPERALGVLNMTSSDSESESWNRIQKAFKRSKTHWRKHSCMIMWMVLISYS